MGFIEKHKKILIILATILCIATVILTVRLKNNPSLFENGLGFVLTPVQEFFTGIGHFVENQATFFADKNELRLENEKLKSEIDKLLIDNKRLDLLESENLKLSELLKIDVKYPELTKIGAEVIGRDGGNWYDNFIINKGTNHGLSKNMAVLAAGGLLGRIVEAGATYSKVVLLVDDSSSVSAKSARTDDIGYVRGDLQLSESGFCRMEYLNINAQLMEGDEIITSQLSDIYPPGIVIGYVREVKTDSNGLTKYAIIEPLVDFKHIETVLVVTDKGGI